jgi:histidinol-phosphatase
VGKDDVDLARAMDVARRAAEAAGKAALARWRRLAPGDVARKPDGSVVTVADREAEAAALAVIRAAFPSHAVLAEETGSHAGEGPWRWVVDPLDGTTGFSRGGPSWGPIVGLERGGDVVAGAIALPVSGREYWAARGHGCWRDGERCRLAPTARWQEAIVAVGGVRRLLCGGGPSSAVATLAAASAGVRAPGDLASCALLLDGAADVWFEAGVKVWDLAGCRVLVEEAGGVFTDFRGAPRHDTGEALAAVPALHAHALAALRA